MGAGHSHGHDGLSVAADRERVLFVAVIAIGLATIAGMVLLRPTGDIHGRAAETGIQSERYKGTVTEATREFCSYATTESPRMCLRVKVSMQQGPDKGTIVDLGEAGQLSADDPFAPDLEEGDGVILGYEPANDVYFYSDRDRRETLLVLGALFAVVVIALGRWRGVA